MIKTLSKMAMGFVLSATLFVGIPWGLWTLLGGWGIPVAVFGLLGAFAAVGGLDEPKN